MKEYSGKRLVLSFFGFLGFLVILSGILIWIADRKDNSTVTFLREVHINRPAAELKPYIDELTLWPAWNFHLIEAIRVDRMDRPFPLAEQVPERGAILILKMEPPKKQWKRYELKVEVTDYVKGSKVRLLLINDNVDRLTKQLKNLSWDIKISDSGLPENQTLIEGSLVAETVDLRARFFAMFSQSIYLNQLYTMNLEAFRVLPSGPKVPRLSPVTSH